MKIYKEYYDKNERNKTHKYYNDKISSDTMRYQKKYNFELNQRKGHETWNCEADAFKHAYGSALMTLDRDELFSTLAGWQHEKVTPNNPLNENKMDTHNNNVGRKVAKEIKNSYKENWNKLSRQQQEDIIADRVWKHMQAGDLILSPDGRRELKGVSKGSNKKSDTSDRTPCVGSYPVSGYTRSDGREVKGYTRTCGAKHQINSSKNGNRSGFAPEQQEIKRDNGGCWGGSGVVMSAKDRQKVLDKYKGKKAQDLSKNEIAEFLRAYL